MLTTDSDISLFALWRPYGCKKNPKTFITAAASQSSHKMSMSVSAWISWTEIGQSRMKPHFIWPVWPSGNVIETLFCWKTFFMWVRSGSGTPRNESSVRFNHVWAEFSVFFRWHQTRGTTDSVAWISVQPHFKPPHSFFPHDPSTAPNVFTSPSLM